MKKVDLTKGKVISVLAKLSIPIMLSSLLQFTYNIIDMFWVGALGSDAVASIGSSSFYVGLGYSINALVVTGVGIKVAHAMGMKREKEAKEYINNGLFINLVLAVVFGFILIVFGKGFIGFLELNNKKVERDAYIYLVLNAPILFFNFYNYLYSRILSSFGNTKAPLVISAIGIVVNIILDPILIYTFKLGVFGAALGTLIANIIMFIIYVYKGRGILSYNFSLGLSRSKIEEISRLGFPMASQRVLFTLINIVLAKVVAKYGSDAIAAQKIGLQIESITYMIIGGLNGAIASFIGQNYGAKDYKRVKEGYRTALLLGIGYAFIVSLLFMFFNKELIRIFIKDEHTVLIGAAYLKAVGFSQIFSAIEMISNGTFAGLGKPKIPAIISIVFTSLRIPMAIYFGMVMGINGVWVSIALSSILKGVTALGLNRRLLKKIN